MKWMFMKKALQRIPMDEREKNSHILDKNNKINKKNCFKINYRYIIYISAWNWNFKFHCHPFWLKRGCLAFVFIENHFKSFFLWYYHCRSRKKRPRTANCLNFNNDYCKKNLLLRIHSNIPSRTESFH